MGFPYFLKFNYDQKTLIWTPIDVLGDNIIDKIMYDFEWRNLMTSLYS